MKRPCYPTLNSILLMLALFIYSAPNLQAHVDQDNMPDAVAEMEYRILLEFQPDNIEVRNKLAMVLYRLDKLDEAFAELQRILILAPDNFDALDALGLVSFKQGKMVQAREYLEAAARLNNEDILVHYHLGLVQDKLGLLDAAEASLVKALTNTTEQNNQSGKNNEIGLIEKALSEVRAQKREKND